MLFCVLHVSQSFGKQFPRLRNMQVVINMDKAHPIIYHVYFKLNSQIYNALSLGFRCLNMVCGVIRNGNALKIGQCLPVPIDK